MNKGERKKILLIEDEAIIALSEKMALEEYGYEVLRASSGEEAISAYGKDKSVDLILMDINLGQGIDGVETARSILKTREIPIVFLSSHTESEIVEKTEKTTSYGYVVKSSSMTVLDASIKMAFKLFAANQATKNSMNKLKAAQEALPDQFFETGPDGMIYDYHFPQPKSIEGSPLNAPGRTVADIVPPRAAEVILSSIQEAREKGKSFGKQYEVSSPAGTNWFEISASMIEGDAPEPRFILLCHDITQRKRLEEEQIASNKMFQAVLDAIPQYICWKDRNSVFLGCNKNHSDLFGLPDTKSILGKTDYELHGDNDARKFISDDLAVMASDIPSYHIIEMVHYPNGAEKWLDTNKVPLHDAHGKVYGIMIAYSDITGKRKLESALSQEQSYLQKLLDNSPDRIYFKDKDSRFIRASKSMCKILGCSDVSELLGRTDLDFFTAEHGKQAFDDEQTIIKTGKVLIREEKETYKDRPDSWVHTTKMPLTDNMGNIVGTFGISRDISDLKKMEEALKRSNERGRGIIEKISDYIFSVYLEGEKIVETIHGQSCLAVTGYTTEEFAADPLLWFNMIAMEDRARVQEHSARIISESLSESIEHRIRRKDGTLRWIRNTPVLHRDESGTLISYDGIIVDITDRKLAENEVQELLQEKELILKEVHHRIKNNMTTVSSLLSLQASTVKEPNAVKALHDAMSRVQSMTVLYDKLYTSSDFLFMSMKDYLPALAEEILDIFPNSQSVRLDVRAEDFKLNTKLLPPLGIMINEILTNTMKYAFKGREIGSIGLSAFLRDGSVHIEIKDDGVGLPEDIDFENSESFGFMLVKLLAQQIGGEIKLQRGNGTSYHLVFNSEG